MRRSLCPSGLLFAITHDDFWHPADLYQFPYDDTTYPVETFPFAIRFDADYVDAFDNLDRINGHLADQHRIEIRVDTPLSNTWPNALPAAARINSGTAIAT